MNLLTDADYVRRIKVICFTQIVLKLRPRGGIEMCTLLGRLPNFGSRPNTMLWVANFRLCVRPSTKSFFDFDEIWYTGSTR